jgi:large subunit ribosomal protein L25
MSEVLHVTKRTSVGTRSSIHLRREGYVPAVLYGHGKDPVTLSLPAEEFRTTLRHGMKVVELDGDADGQALLQEVQWDTFFQHVLHVDLLRVVAGEKIKLTVAIELRGAAPGANDGVVEQLLREVEIEVTPAEVPEKLHININQLELDGALTVADIEDLPEGATVLADAAETVVQCIARSEELGDELAAGDAEPEVIGQKGESGEASDENSDG